LFEGFDPMLATAAPGGIGGGADRGCGFPAARSVASRMPGRPYQGIV
jgi:hypothetical protein